MTNDKLLSKGHLPYSDMRPGMMFSCTTDQRFDAHLFCVVAISFRDSAFRSALKFKIADLKLLSARGRILQLSMSATTQPYWTLVSDPTRGADHGDE